ncbi:hypothetical protein C5167_023532 [Papaver somniferum]|uniref:F-box/LRR-repeat protein 15/At3g58940/PEG3-like LRR domain-containing protein n=1 Tax=Papaver somniferum TaxID=3469 RepID=A0A4Y7JLZ4_PAPSO|nr:hypothetical protein C5167_023532 [Papaver somniferum]
MPLSLFTCESLITLKLDICTRMYLPKYISCLRLKHLQLRGVDFSDEYNSEQLFSKCPILEELMLQDCDWSGMRNFRLSAPALKILKICGVLDHCRWYNPYRLQGCALKIDAPNLVSLSYKCALAKEYVASGFQTLDDADLDFNFDKNAGDATRRVYMIGLGAVASCFFQAPHVKRLSISDRVLRVLSCAADLRNHLPTFHYLKQLNAEREAIHSLVWRLGVKTQNSEGHDDNEDGNRDDDWDPDTMTTGCLLLQLKSVSFEVFSGVAGEYRLTKLSGCLIHHRLMLFRTAP